jgi:hypothetical protein
VRQALSPESGRQAGQKRPIGRCGKVQNMEQEGFTGMQAGSDPTEGRFAAPLQLEWWLQLESWRDSLDRCACKASRKRVHELRILTLRLQASLEFWLSEQPPDAQGVRAVKRWKTQGQKLRRALRPVRETDVYLERLASLRGRPSRPSADLQPRLPARD